MSSSSSWASSLSRFVYGPTPQERVKKWQTDIKAEQRRLDRETRRMEQAQIQTKGQLKQLAQKGQVKHARQLAKELVASRKAKDRLITSKTMLSSINMQLSHQLAVLKITGSLEKSAEILKLSNALIKLPELNRTMMTMSQEMTKAGLISEMVDDAMDTLEDEDLEEEADQEVERVLFEITDGKLGQASAAKLPTLAKPTPTQEEYAAEEEETAKMRAELNALLGN